LAAGVYLIVSVNTAFEGIGFKLLNAFIVVVQLLSYLNVAVSNPGILLSNPVDITEDKEQVERYLLASLDFARFAISACLGDRITAGIVTSALPISTITARGPPNALEGTI
jgi:hypothetical protein